MRALPICLLALMLSGCSMLSRSPVEPAQSTATPPVKSEPSKPRATRPAPVRIYTDASELVGKPFRDLGEVSGEVLPGFESGFSAEYPHRAQAPAN